MDTLLRCQVSRGLFSGEVAIRGKCADGTDFSLFVPDEYVDCKSQDIGDRMVDGWVVVDVLQTKGPLLLLRLPGESFENGRTILVEDSQIEKRSFREKV
jgi:hypothetical protein